MSHLLLYLGTKVMIATAPPTDAQNLCSGAALGSDCNDPSTVKNVGSSLTTHITSLVGTLLEVAGAVAVIIIIIGGITYVTSNGDAARVKQAKDTILYAVIGLVVAILAYAIVHYVSTSV